MKYTIYRTTNLINGKTYIGKHQTENPNDSYIGSGRALKAAIKKYGKENFKKEVLYVFDTEEEMDLKEKELVNEEFYSKDDNYNCGPGGEGGAHFKGKKHSDETKAKISKANRGNINIIETAIKNGHASKGRKLSEQAKENIRKGAQKRFENHIYKTTPRPKKGNYQTQEWRNNISKAMKGKKRNTSHIPKKRWINNNLKQTLLPINESIPRGWKLGMLTASSSTV